jgi:predicted NUDIX family NTP pyrophosphohydrolase
MATQSAGIRGVEVFLVHPGGPYWEKKDAGAWSIPKGECLEDEDPLNAAKRECQEETGLAIEGDFWPLGSVKQPSGKIVIAWAVEANPDASLVKSNPFKMEWPPRSGKTQEFPEIDKAGWFSMQDARKKVLKGQVAFLERLSGLLAR